MFGAAGVVGCTRAGLCSAEVRPLNAPPRARALEESEIEAILKRTDACPKGYQVAPSEGANAEASNPGDCAIKRFDGLEGVISRQGVAHIVTRRAWPVPPTTKHYKVQNSSARARGFWSPGDGEHHVRGWVRRRLTTRRPSGGAQQAGVSASARRRGCVGSFRRSSL